MTTAATVEPLAYAERVTVKVTALGDLQPGDEVIALRNGRALVRVPAQRHQ